MGNLSGHKLGRFFTSKMAWFTPLLCNSCCKVPIMEVEAENFERTGDIYVYGNKKQYGDQQWLSE